MLILIQVLFIKKGKLNKIEELFEKAVELNPGFKEKVKELE